MTSRSALLLTFFGCAHHDPGLPLELVADVPLPGGATRFDYQAIDSERGLLAVAHMNDGTVLLLDLDGALKAEIPNVPTARGVVVAAEVGRIFVTSAPNQVVEIDTTTLTEAGRFEVGSGPDGIAWDPVDAMVAVSDQGAGSLSLIPDGGHGQRTDVALGDETGNVVWDGSRGWSWIAVSDGTEDRIVAVEPKTAVAVATLDLPGCDGAHGLLLHPDGASAFVACEGNDRLARVLLEGNHEVQVDGTGRGPDVVAIDPGLGWLYVASESGELTVFDLAVDGVVRIDSETPGPDAHTVAVDPTTHRVYFPLERGDEGTPVLRILRPTLIAGH